jgi:hypothetical protein
LFLFLLASGQLKQQQKAATAAIVLCMALVFYQQNTNTKFTKQQHSTALPATASLKPIFKRPSSLGPHVQAYFKFRSIVPMLKYHICAHLKTELCDVQSQQIGVFE